MSGKDAATTQGAGYQSTRRKALGVMAGSAGAVLATTFGVPFRGAQAQNLPSAKEEIMTTKAFVYTEVQISVPFEAAPWAAINGMHWIPEEPVPITATRWAVKSTPSWGHRPVW